MSSCKACLLILQKGDTIDLIAKNPSGLWKGCVDGRVGHFKFILVEEEVERPVRKSRAWRGNTPRRGRSRTLEELLNRLHLGHLIQVRECSASPHPVKDT